jgi:hypothetical protein
MNQSSTASLTHSSSGTPQRLSCFLCVGKGDIAEAEAAAHSGEARSSVSYDNRVERVLLMLPPACGDVVACSEAERGTISRDEQHSSGRTHFRVGMRPHVDLNSPNKGPDTPSPYLRG